MATINCPHCDALMEAPGNCPKCRLRVGSLPVHFQEIPVLDWDERPGFRRRLRWQLDNRYRGLTGREAYERDTGNVVNEFLARRQNPPDVVIPWPDNPENNQTTILYRFVRGFDSSDEIVYDNLYLHIVVCRPGARMAGWHGDVDKLISKYKVDNEKSDIGASTNTIGS